MIKGLRSTITETAGYAGTKFRERFNQKWNERPFGDSILASRNDYLAIFDEARQLEFSGVDEVEAELGFAIDRKWLDELALHTQVCVKRYKGSRVMYPHGRLLYSILRRYIADNNPEFVQVVETGTAKGFSALCMAKALADSGAEGNVTTIDLLPHARRIIWNAIDDHEGKKTRAELLRPWSELTRRITFLQGNTLSMLPNLGLERVNFAFLDARHVAVTVMAEFQAIYPKQHPGDMIFFDDVTPSMFPGVVKAVDRIESKYGYDLQRLIVTDRRGYAWGPKPSSNARA